MIAPLTGEVEEILEKNGVSIAEGWRARICELQAALLYMGEIPVKEKPETGFLGNSTAKNSLHNRHNVSFLRQDSAFQFQNRKVKSRLTTDGMRRRTTKNRFLRKQRGRGLHSILNNKR